MKEKDTNWKDTNYLIEIIMFCLCWIVVAIIAITGIIAMTANTANAGNPVKDMPQALTADKIYSVMDNLLERIYQDHEDYYIDVLQESDEYDNYIEIMNILK